MVPQLNCTVKVYIDRGVTTMKSLAKVLMTEDKYKALQAVVSKGDAIHKRFKEFKAKEAIIVKKLWGFIPHKSYNHVDLFKEFDTELTSTNPIFGGEGNNRWYVYDNYRLRACRSLLKFKPHEECYLTSKDCEALNWAVDKYGDKE